MFILGYFLNFIPKQYHTLCIQFIKFGIVGLSGLFLDTLTVYLLRSIIGLFPSTLLAYFVAATSNWLINRLWTFNGLGNQQHFIYQWLCFIGTNSLGFFLNRGSVFLLFLFSSTCQNHPVIALAIGAIAGMLANFNLSKKLVYNNKLNPKK